MRTAWTHIMHSKHAEAHAHIARDPLTASAENDATPENHWYPNSHHLRAASQQNVGSNLTLDSGDCRDVPYTVSKTPTSPSFINHFIKPTRNVSEQTNLCAVRFISDSTIYNHAKPSQRTLSINSNYAFVKNTK